MGVYYNEFDPHAAAWLRELIREGHIADGIVDERSIEDVVPSDLAGFHQCHFFAGIGVWSYALRRAGWPDDRQVWTGSCPCQPFSAAGKGLGFDDERHLWPAFHWIIEQQKPAVIFGEQVASKDVEPWIDLVQADLEKLDYAVGCVPFPSAGVGAPHIRDRAYWVADTNDQREVAARDRSRGRNLGGNGETFRLADANGPENHAADPEGFYSKLGRSSTAGELADAGRERADGPGPTSGFWRDADWLRCRDDRWRPVEPGASPLVDGAPARVVRLRGYGNAINAEAATAFIQAYLEVRAAA